MRDSLMPVALTISVVVSTGDQTLSFQENRDDHVRHLVKRLQVLEAALQRIAELESRV